MSEKSRAEIVRAKIVNLEETVALLRLRLELRKFDPNEPRWREGLWNGGRWRRLTDVESESDEAPVLVAGKMDKRREALCEYQYEQDIELCRASRSPLCWSQAMIRKVACMKNEFIPPLLH